jgi:hypothetical protein
MFVLKSYLAAYHLRQRPSQALAMSKLAYEAASRQPTGAAQSCREARTFAAVATVTCTWRHSCIAVAAGQTAGRAKLTISSSARVSNRHGTIYCGRCRAVYSYMCCCKHATRAGDTKLALQTSTPAS